MDNFSSLRLMSGPLPLAGAAVLAPMSGVTDLGMRRAAMRFGATLVVSEMVASDHLAGRETEALLRAEGDGVTPHVVQIAGTDPYWMGEGARAAEAAGAAVIDINMGCPVKRVTNGWSGSALMRDLDHACRLIEATVAAVSVPVTLKTRLGWDHDSLNAAGLARRAEHLGIRMITIHARTRQQFYKGHADWRLARSVRDATTLPMLINGDIDGIASARAALAASGADGVMIGRAAMGRPWLVGDVAARLRGQVRAEPTPAAKAEAAIGHYGWLLSAMGRDKGLRHARKHVAAYLDEARACGTGLDSAEAAALLTSETPEIVMAGLERAIQDSDTGRAVA